MIRAQSQPFSIRTLGILIIVGIAAFFGSVYFAIFGDDSGSMKTNGPNAFSVSAIGDKAFIELLNRRGVTTLVSRFDSARRAGRSGLLVLAQPTGDDGVAAIDQAMSGPTALIVLPKWTGEPKFPGIAWLKSMSLLPEETVNDVLKQIIPGAAIQRGTARQTIEAARFGGTLQLTFPQVIAGDGVTAILATRDGVLIAERQSGGKRIWILADPDLISNHGLDDADNATVALNMIEQLRPKGGVVLFDEVIHGYEQRPNLLREAFRPPFLGVMISGIATIALAIWAGALRFGAPPPLQPAIAAGKTTLLANAAGLLGRSGSSGFLLQRYARMILAQAIAALHGPRGVSAKDQVLWLDKLAPSIIALEHLTPRVAEIDRLTAAKSLQPHAAIAAALKLYRWKQEVLDGNIPDSRHRG